MLRRMCTPSSPLGRVSPLCLRSLRQPRFSSTSTSALFTRDVMMSRHLSRQGRLCSTRPPQPTQQPRPSRRTAFTTLQAQTVRLMRFVFLPWQRDRVVVEADPLKDISSQLVKVLIRSTLGFIRAAFKGVGTWTNRVVHAAHHHLSPGVAAGLLWAAIVAAMVMCAPTAPFNLAAGAVLGVRKGAFVALTSLWVGSLIDYNLAKGFFSEFAERQVSALSLGDGVAAFDGATFSFMLRCCILLPAGAVSYGLGATGMDVRDFAFGTLAGQSVTAYLISGIGYHLRVLSQEQCLMRRAYLKLSVASVSASLILIAVASTYQLTAMAMRQ